MLSDEEMQALYSSKYFQGQVYLDYEKEQPALRRNFFGRLVELQKMYPRGSHLWEIGAAYGFFIDEAAKWFDAAGCDISEHAASQARKRGLQVITGDYLDMPAPPQPRDIVCLWDTIEHLRTPHLYLEKAAHELRSGGMLVFSTGDIASRIARWRGEKWRLIEPPIHLHYFCPASAMALLQRLGFRLPRICYHAFWRHADAVVFQLLANPPTRRTAPLYRCLKTAGLLEFYFPINTFDLMTVSAIKK